MTPLERLSPSERQTAALIYAGWSVDQIIRARKDGTRLTLLQIDNIYRKLHISSEHELAEIYQRYRQG